VVRYWHGYLPAARCKWFEYGPADATATPSSFAPVKSRNLYLSGAGLPKLSWKAVVVVVWETSAAYRPKYIYATYISAKKYQNPFMFVKVKASQRWDIFLRHGVWSVRQLQGRYWANPVAWQWQSQLQWRPITAMIASCKHRVIGLTKTSGRKRLTSFF